jgi:hypothetical protein
MYQSIYRLSIAIKRGTIYRFSGHASDRFESARSILAPYGLILAFYLRQKELSLKCSAPA